MTDLFFFHIFAIGVSNSRLPHTLGLHDVNDILKLTFCAYLRILQYLKEFSFYVFHHHQDYVKKYSV